jgi:hypothetical protein
MLRGRAYVRHSTKVVALADGHLASVDDSADPHLRCRRDREVDPDFGTG